jgi:O-antigen/teichoic acid export membrane protein
MKTKKAVVANFVGQGWTAISGFIFVPVYISLLGIEAYGVIGFFAVLQASLSILDLGMTPTVSRQLARYTGGGLSDRDAVSVIRGLAGLSAIIGLLIVVGLTCAAGYLAAHWFRDAPFSPATLRVAFYGIAVVIGLRFCEGLLRGALIGLDRQVLLNVLLVVFATLRNGGVVVALLLFGKRLPVFFAFQAYLSLVVVLTFAVAVHRSLPRLPLRSFAIAPLREALGYSAGMFVIAASSLAITQADKIILSRVVRLSDYSPYMLAVTLAGALPLIVGPIAQGVFPRLVRAVEVRDEASLAHLYHLASQSAAVLIVPVILLAALFPAEVILGWSGNRQLAQSLVVILPLVVAGTGANALYWLPYHAQLALGWTRMMARYNSVMALVVTSALLLLAPRYGTIAGAMLWLLLNVSYLALLVPVLHRNFLPHQLWRWYRGTLLYPVLSAGLVIAGARLLLPSPPSRLSCLALVIPTYLGGVVAAAAAAPMVRQFASAQSKHAWRALSGRFLGRRAQPSPLS